MEMEMEMEIHGDNLELLAFYLPRMRSSMSGSVKN